MTDLISVIVATYNRPDALAAVLRAFQRHWRPEAVTGQADAGTLARLLAVVRMVAPG